MQDRSPSLHVDLPTILALSLSIFLKISAGFRPGWNLRPSTSNFPPPVKDLVIGITQSGETADTLAALKHAKKSGCSTLAITNVLGSSVTRVADITLFMRAGPEISVAATKSFFAQLAILMQIVNNISETKYDEVLQQAHKAIEEVLLWISAKR